MLQTAPGLSSGSSLSLTFVSKRRKVNMGLSIIRVILILLLIITYINIIVNIILTIMSKRKGFLI